MAIVSGLSRAKWYEKQVTRLSSVKRLQALLIEMRGVNIRPTPLTVGSAMEIYNNAEMYPSALALYREYSRSPSRLICSHALNALNGSGMMYPALELLEEMSERGWGVAGVQLKRIKFSSVGSGALLHQLRVMGVDVDIRTLNRVLEECTTDMDIIQLYEGFGRKRASQRLLKAAFKAYISVGDDAGASGVFGRMESISSSSTNDEELQQMLIDQFLVHKQWAQAIGAYISALNKGLKLKFDMPNVLSKAGIDCDPSSPNLPLLLLEHVGTPSQSLLESCIVTSKPITAYNLLDSDNCTWAQLEYIILSCENIHEALYILENVSIPSGDYGSLGVILESNHLSLDVVHALSMHNSAPSTALSISLAQKYRNLSQDDNIMQLYLLTKQNSSLHCNLEWIQLVLPAISQIEESSHLKQLLTRLDQQHYHEFPLTMTKLLVLLSKMTESHKHRCIARLVALSSPYKFKYPVEMPLEAQQYLSAISMDWGRGYRLNKSSV